MDAAVETVVQDPVCGMTVDPAVARHTATHEGERFYFCSAGCQAKFEAEPAKYLGRRPAPESRCPTRRTMHVIDVVPTILEVTGIPAPKSVDGIEQAPIEGTSFAYTFDAANADAPSRHKIQYFEMMGQWALYDERWLLSTKVNRAPWEAFGPANPDPLNNQVFQLMT